MRRPTIVITALLAAVAATGAAGCASPQSGSKVNGAAAASAGADSEKDDATDAALPDGVYRFGNTVKFEDGSTLTVRQPVAFTPDKYGAGGDKFKQHVKFKVTFVNRSKKVFDPALTTGSVSSGDREGDAVFQDGLDAPDNKLLPGRKVTWWMGYGVNSAKKVTLTVSMGFLDYDDAIFTNEG